MKGMGNLEIAFRYPFSGEGWGAKFVFGGILYVLGAILGFIPGVGGVLWMLTAFLPLGYAYEIFRNHLQGVEGPPPAWGKWDELYIQGLWVFLISLGYWILPGLLYWLGKMFWGGGGFSVFLGVLFIILGVGIGLVAFFLLPMAIAFYATENGSFGAAFRWSEIVEKIWVVQREYFIGWLACLILFLVLLFVRTYFLYIGWILHAFGFFYLSLVVANLFGRVGRESMEARD
jgi:hypothetical protein